MGDYVFTAVFGDGEVIDEIDTENIEGLCIEGGRSAWVWKGDEFVTFICATGEHIGIEHPWVKRERYKHKPEYCSYPQFNLYRE